MSIASMSRLAVEAAEQRKSGTAAGASATTTTSVSTAPAVAAPRGAAMLTAIADWMPSEAVAFYLGALGLFPPNNDPSKDEVQRWVVFGAGSAVVFLLVSLNVLVRVKLNGVAVDERMVLRQAESVGSSECRSIGLPVSRELHRAGERRFQQAGITQAGSATVFAKLLVMNRMDDRRVDPDPSVVGRLHFASSCSTLRRLRMIARAAFI